MKTENSPKIDIFHLHEVTDRLHVVINTLEDHLISHPVCDKYEDIKAIIEAGQQKLIEAYQLVGKFELDEFDSDSYPNNNG